MDTRQRQDLKNVLRAGALTLLLIFSWIEQAEGQLFGLFRWKDEKGNCVAARSGTIGGQAPAQVTLPLKDIADQFFGTGRFSTTGGISYDQDQADLRALTAGQQEAFFRGIQRALAQTGKAEYSLNFPGSYVHYLGIQKGFEDVIADLAGPFEGEYCRQGR